MAGFFPVLKIEDFVLRELENEDIEAISKIWGSTKVTEKTTQSPLTHDESIQMLYVIRSLWENDAGIRWGVEKCGGLIGTCGFHNLNRGARRGELGYELDYEYWGRGYMRKALQPVLDYGFNIMRFERVEVFLNVDNDRSDGLLKKLGFKLEGTLRDYALSPKGLMDQSCYSLLKRDWKEQSTQVSARQA
ncbi:MAG: GNAT family N-acetyltransferase [Synergistaceae bacterium]|jgi:ribosomal-protein-alanine N-acetyltransferase|nr:GNAT family N-acetyltransferase [Synergistaceae bacterium]